MEVKCEISGIDLCCGCYKAMKQGQCNILAAHCFDKAHVVSVFSFSYALEHLTGM